MPQKFIKSKSQLGNFIFDDCPICRAMKAADEQGRGLTESELREAFKKAKGKTVSLGGKTLE